MKMEDKKNLNIESDENDYNLEKDFVRPGIFSKKSGNTSDTTSQRLSYQKNGEDGLRISNIRISERNCNSEEVEGGQALSYIDEETGYRHHRTHSLKMNIE